MPRHLSVQEQKERVARQCILKYDGCSSVNTIRCEECGDNFCEVCDAKHHKEINSLHHRRVPMTWGLGLPYTDIPNCEVCQGTRKGQHSCDPLSRYAPGLQHLRKVTTDDDGSVDSDEEMVGSDSGGGLGNDDGDCGCPDEQCDHNANPFAFKFQRGMIEPDYCPVAPANASSSAKRKMGDQPNSGGKNKQIKREHSNGSGSSSNAGRAGNAPLLAPGLIKFTLQCNYEINPSVNPAHTRVSFSRVSVLI